MSYANHEINALITVDPAKAKGLICAALRASGMHKGLASKELGCTHSTLLRWIDKLDLDDTIEEMLVQAQKKGWRFNGRTGRPKGSTVKNGAAPRGSLKVKKGAKVRRKAKRTSRRPSDKRVTPV